MYVVAALVLVCAGLAGFMFYGSAEAVGRTLGYYDRRKARQREQEEVRRELDRGDGC